MKIHIRYILFSNKISKNFVKSVENKTTSGFKKRKYFQHTHVVMSVLIRNFFCSTNKNILTVFISAKVQLTMTENGHEKKNRKVFRV